MVQHINMWIGNTICYCERVIEGNLLDMLFIWLNMNMQNHAMKNEVYELSQTFHATEVYL
jgi:hypothetical protein